MLCFEQAPRVSVIVPIYNVERYLECCIRSIQEQTLSDIEIILVDDKTPDRSGEIADSLAKGDGRITVVHREANGGLGPARNSGIEIAKGDYLMFVDSDDWVDPNIVEELYSLSSRSCADICFCGRRMVGNGVVIKEENYPSAGKILIGEEIERFRKEYFGPLPENIVDTPILISAWAALYRRSFVEANQLRFDNVRSEDVVFNILATRSANSIAFCKEILYNYRKDNQSSITTSVSPKSIESFFVLFDKLLKLANDEPHEIREECLIRASRKIIDLSRGAICTIHGSNVDDATKRELDRAVIYHPLVTSILKHYPIWKTPHAQALFSFCMKMKWVEACARLAEQRLKRGM